MNAPAFDFAALVANAAADNPDAALLDAIERNHDQHRGLNRRRRPATLAEVTPSYRERCRQWLELRERIAGMRPATREGLVAKLRFALGGASEAPAFCVQHGALRDALEWLDPPKPKRRRRAC